MKEIQEKAWYIQEAEFAVLLAASGVQEFYGYKLDGISRVNQASINRIVFNLVRKGILIPAENGFVLKEEYRKIIKCLKGTEKILIFNDTAQEYPEQYIYIGYKAVFLQTFGQNGHILRLEVMDKEQIYAKLTARGLKMEGTLENLLGQVDTRENMDNLIRKLWKQKREQILKNKDVFGYLERIDWMSRKRTGQLLLLDKGIQNLILISEGKDHSTYQYSMEKLHELLDEFIKG